MSRARPNFIGRTSARLAVGPLRSPISAISAICGSFMHVGLDRRLRRGQLSRPLRRAPPLHPRFATFFIVASGALAPAGRLFRRPSSAARSSPASPWLSGLCACDRPDLRRIGAGSCRRVVWGVSVIADSAQFSGFRPWNFASPPARRHADRANLHRLPADPREHPSDALCGGLLGWRYAFASWHWVRFGRRGDADLARSAGSRGMAGGREDRILFPVVENPVQRALLIVGDDQRAVGQFGHVHRAAE